MESRKWKFFFNIFSIIQTTSENNIGVSQAKMKIFFRQFTLFCRDWTGNSITKWWVNLKFLFRNCFLLNVSPSIADRHSTWIVILPSLSGCYQNEPFRRNCGQSFFSNAIKRLKIEFLFTIRRIWNSFLTFSFFWNVIIFFLLYGLFSIKAHKHRRKIEE